MLARLPPSIASAAPFSCSPPGSWVARVADGAAVVAALSAIDRDAAAGGAGLEESISVTTCTG